MVVVVVVDDEVEELQRLDRARVLVKPPQQPIIKHNVSTWINRVGYTVHMVEETCYNPNRCICRRGSFIRSSEEISSDESHKGTPLPERSRRTLPEKKAPYGGGECGRTTT